MTERWLSRIIRAVCQGLRLPVRQGDWWRRIRRGCLISLTVVALLSCLSCLLLGVLVRKATAVGSGASLDVILSIDNSNSMFDKGGIGSDPDMRRIEAAQMFISYLGIDSEASHRLGIVFFGGDAELVAPLTSLAGKERRDEMAALIADPQRMDWTNPVAALRLSHQTLLVERGEDSQSVVIMLTDGKPEWDNSPTRDERQAVIDELKHIGGQYAEDRIELFIILLTNEVTESDSEIGDIYVPLWKEITESSGGHFYSVRRADDLFAIYHDILLTLSDVQSTGPVLETQLEDEAQRKIVAVEPGLARVTFLVRLSHPDVEVVLYRPGGRALTPQNEDVRYASQDTSVIWNIESPEPGDWELLMDGQGQVTVWKDFLPAPINPTPALSPTPAPTFTPSPTVTGTVEEGVTMTTTEATGRYTDTAETPEGLPNSGPYSEEATRTTTVRRSSRIWMWIAGVGMLMVGLGSWGFYRKRRHLPRLTGKLRVLEAPVDYAGPALIDLSLLNRRSVKLGRGDVGLPSPSNGNPWGIICALSDGSGMELTPCDGQIVRVNGYELDGPHLLSDEDRIASDKVRLRYEHLQYAI